MDLDSIKILQLEIIWLESKFSINNGWPIYVKTDKHKNAKNPDFFVTEYLVQEKIYLI